MRELRHWIVELDSAGRTVRTVWPGRDGSPLRERGSGDWSAAVVECGSRTGGAGFEVVSEQITTGER